MDKSNGPGIKAFFVRAGLIFTVYEHMPAGQLNVMCILEANGLSLCWNTGTDLELPIRLAPSWAHIALHWLVLQTNWLVSAACSEKMFMSKQLQPNRPMQPGSVWEIRQCLSICRRQVACLVVFERQIACLEYFRHVPQMKSDTYGCVYGLRSTLGLACVLTAEHAMTQ